MAIYRRGDLLTAGQKREVLRTYIYRYTTEHVPNGWKGKPPHFKSDNEWLRRTYFPLTPSGKLRRAAGASCHSNTSNPLINAYVSSLPCNEKEIQLP